MAYADFDAMFRRSQHGIVRHFRTGSGGGRNGDTWRGSVDERQPFADHFQIIKRIAGIGHQRGGRLGEINHAAAAKADHQIALQRLNEPDDPLLSTKAMWSELGWGTPEPPE